MSEETEKAQKERLGRGPASIRDRAWERAPGSGEFIDPRKEQFAICLAKGMSIKRAAKESRVNLDTANRKWSRESFMVERVQQLRRQNPTVVMGVPQVLNELRENAELAREAGQFKASTEAWALIYKIVKQEASALEARGTDVIMTDRRQLLDELEQPVKPLPTPDIDTDGEPVLDANTHIMHIHDATTEGDE